MRVRADEGEAESRGVQDLNPSDLTPPLLDEVGKTLERGDLRGKVGVEPLQGGLKASLHRGGVQGGAVFEGDPRAEEEGKDPLGGVDLPAVGQVGRQCAGAIEGDETAGPPPAPACRSD